MNRKDIVEYARNNGKHDFSRITVREALDFVIEEMTQSLLSGEDVKLTGFGAFKIRNRAARMGRNPHTHEPLLIKGHKVVVFLPIRNFWEKGVRNSGKAE